MSEPASMQHCRRKRGTGWHVRFHAAIESAPVRSNAHTRSHKPGCFQPRGKTKQLRFKAKPGRT
eukprot:4999627-Alexandrium_andersonii.AAC.1